MRSIINGGPAASNQNILPTPPAAEPQPEAAPQESGGVTGALMLVVVAGVTIFSMVKLGIPLVAAVVVIGVALAYRFATGAGLKVT